MSIGYSRGYAVGYTWDAAGGVWLRSTDGRPFVSRSGGQIATQNVVILSVVYEGGVGVEGAQAQLTGQRDRDRPAQRHVHPRHLGTS